MTNLSAQQDSTQNSLNHWENYWEKRRGLCMPLWQSLQCGYWTCCITLTPGLPYSPSVGVGGSGLWKKRTYVSKELTSPPSSFQFWTPSSHSYSHFLCLCFIQLYPVIGQIMMAISPAPLSKPAQPLFLFANFLFFPCRTHSTRAPSHRHLSCRKRK